MDWRPAESERADRCSAARTVNDALFSIAVDVRGNENLQERVSDEPIRSARALIGLEVTDPHGDRLGRIEEIILDPPAGRIAYGIASFFGALAYAGKLFAIPWEALRPCGKAGNLTLDIDPADLEGAPSFDRNDWPDMSNRRWSAEVHAYYGLGPYWA